MKTTILWDHDGVLVETEPWYYEATRLTLSELGIALHKDEYLKDMACGISAWERAAAAGVPSDEIGRLKGQRNELYQRFLITKDIDIVGVEAILETLSLDYAMAIVTTSKKQDFELIHRERNITKHMAFVLTSGDYRRSKPYPDPYLAALDRFGVTKEEAVVVEDSERGLRAAVAAGIDCVVVRNDFVTEHDLSAATRQIDSLSMLPQLLREM
jgi:beta-phosphoglucomutase-like phosphatase (HAD superfamily)